MRSRKAGFPFATRAWNRKPCLQRYVSIMIRTENFLSQFISKFFWKPLFSTFMVPCSLLAENIFWFFESAPTPRYTILDSRLPLCNAISEGRLPLCNTSLEAGALPLEVRIDNDSDRKFSKSIFFQSFYGNHFSPRFMVPCSILAENFFSVFRSPRLPLDTLIKKSSCSWTNQKVQQ